MPRRLVLACLVLAGLSPVAMGQMLYSTRILPTREALGRLNLERYWFAAIPLQPGTEQVIHLSLTGGPGIQRISITPHTKGGTFTLTYKDETTVPLPYNATASQVEEALGNLNSIDRDKDSKKSLATCKGGPLTRGAIYVTLDPQLEPQSFLTTDGSGLTGGERRSVVSQPQTLIFAQTSAAQLHALDGESGKLLWSSSLGPATGQATDVAVSSKAVFASNANELIALDRGTGRFLWRQILPAPVASGVTATENEVMVGMTNGQVIAYGIEYGGEEERFRPKEGPPGGFEWAWATTGPVTSRPITSPYVVAFASSGGKLYAARLDKPEILHRSSQLGGLEANMGAFGTGPASTLYVPSLDNSLYAINLFTGEHDWVFPSGAPILSQPLIGDLQLVTEEATETYTETTPDGKEQTKTRTIELSKLVRGWNSPFGRSRDG
jgi:outer membrane protein assembly factor BamB